MKSKPYLRRPIHCRDVQTIVEILKSPQAADRYANVGAEIRYNSPEEFSVLIKAEMAKWAKVIKAAGIKVDER